MDENQSFTKTLLKKIGITLAILIPLVGGIFYLRGHIRESVAQIVEARQEIAQKSQVVNRLSDLRGQYNEFGEDYLNVLENVIPEKDALVNVAEDFERVAIANDVGFGFSFLGEGTLENDSDLGFIRFRLNIVAENMEQVTGFIEDIEDFKYLTTVDRVSINRDQQKEQINLTLQGRVYYQ